MALKKAPKNSEELQQRLLSLYNDIDNDSVDLVKAKTLINASNAVMKIVVAKLVENRITDDTTKIKFLK